MASDEVGPAPGLKWETPAAAPAATNGPAPGLTWESAPNVLAFSRRGGMSNPAMQSAPDAPAEPDVVTLGELRDNPKAAIQRIGAIIGKDVTDPKLWLTMAASYFGPKVFSMAAPIVGKAAAGAMRMAPEVVRSGATAAGAYVGGPAGAVVGRTVGEAVAGRMRPPVPEGPVSSPGYPRAGSTPAPPSAPVEPPAHLDLSQRVPAGGLTQQQIAERLAATKTQGMTAPQVEPVMAQRPSPSSVPVPEGPPEPSMAKPAAEPFNPPRVKTTKQLSEERLAEIQTAYKTAQKAVREAADKAGIDIKAPDEVAVVRKVIAGATPEDAISTLAKEDPAAELARRLGTPSDAERRFPPNKSGLPSNPPTARKARGKVSDLADMPIEPPKPVEPAGPTAENIASVPSGKISDLAAPAETPTAAPVEQTPQAPAKKVRVPKSKVDTPPAAAAQVQQQIKRVVDVEGVKSGAEVQRRVIGTLQNELESASESAGFKSLEFRHSKAYGGREGVVVVDGEPLARVDRYGKMEWLDSSPSYTTAQGKYVPSEPSARGKIGFNNPRGEMTPTEVAREAQNQVATALARQKNAGQIVVDIPGDGTFTIERNPHAIQAVMKRIAAAPGGTWGGVGSVKNATPSVGPVIPKATW